MAAAAAAAPAEGMTMQFFAVFFLLRFVSSRGGATHRRSLNLADDRWRR